MHAVIMGGKKRVMVGAINMVLILLLLQFMNHCSSSSASHDGDASSKNDTIIRPHNTTDSASRWPRRMLASGHRPAFNETTYPIDNHKHKSTNKGPIDGSRASSSDMTLSNNVPEEKDPGDRLQAQECSSSSTAHCANNGTTIDPRYGVEKRLVPTGPNPLHN